MASRKNNLTKRIKRARQSMISKEINKLKELRQAAKQESLRQSEILSKR